MIDRVRIVAILKRGHVGGIPSHIARLCIVLCIVDFCKTLFFELSMSSNRLVSTS